MVGFAKLINYMENKNSSSAKNWGGAREGSGRKKKEIKTKMYYFTSTPEVDSFLSTITENRTAIINEAIARYIKSLKK